MYLLQLKPRPGLRDTFFLKVGLLDACGWQPRGHTALPPAHALHSISSVATIYQSLSSRCATAEETRVLPAHAALSDTSMTARS